MPFFQEQLLNPLLLLKPYPLIEKKERCSLCLWFFCHCGNGPETLMEISFQEMKEDETKILQLDGNDDLVSDSDTCEENQ